jgi:uncharacterized membrane protein YgcG
MSIGSLYVRNKKTTSYNEGPILANRPFLLSFIILAIMKTFVSFVCALFLWGSVTNAYTPPQTKGFINDYTETLSEDQERELENTVQSFFQETGIQIGVALETTLNGKDKFDRAMELSRAWGVGAENDRRGILIYIAKKERKYFIAVSNVLQADITDGIAGELGREALVPYLKDENYFSGIQTLINGLIQHIKSPDLRTKKSQPWYNKLPFYPKTSEGRTTLYVLSILLLITLYFGVGKNIRSRFILNKRIKELGIELKPWHKATPKS